MGAPSVAQRRARRAGRVYLSFLRKDGGRGRAGEQYGVRAAGAKGDTHTAANMRNENKALAGEQYSVRVAERVQAELVEEALGWEKRSFLPTK